MAFRDIGDDHSIPGFKQVGNSVSHIGYDTTSEANTNRHIGNDSNLPSVGVFDGHSCVRSEEASIQNPTEQNLLKVDLLRTLKDGLNADHQYTE